MKKTILIVEDDASLRKLFSIVLSSNGFQCEQANNGLDGFRVLENLHPDLILLDLRMPEMDGLTFLEKIRNNPHFKIPILVVSGTDIDDTRDLARLEGAAGHLVKPVTAKDLIMKVNELLYVPI